MLNILYKLYLKLNKSAYKNKLLYWCKKNQKKNIVLLTFDCETQRDMDVLDKLHKKLSDIKITPYFAVPGELIEKNKLLIQNLSKKKCFFINHGYKIHTIYDDFKKKNFSSFSYNNLAKSVIAEDIIKGHNSIKKITGQIPDIFRTPHFGSYSNKNSMNFIYDILFDLGYKFSSSTTPIYSFSKAPFYKTNNIIEVPISSCLNKPLQIIDSWAFIGSKDKTEITDLIDEMNKYFILMENNTFFLNTYFDPSDIINYDIFFETLSKFTKWSVNDFGQLNDKETKKNIIN
ncbi:polysaccharide deacetylase family protein [Rickettsiales bacterium]|nr:polysaccharide deacetylase family protein [Rickettsiales bacterium]